MTKTNAGITIPLILVASTTLAGCSSLNRQLSNLVFPPHWYSNERNGEKVDLEIFLKQKPVLDCPGGARAAIPALAPIVAGALVKGIESFLRTEAALYQASYSATVASDGFYENACPDKLNVNLRSILLQRRVKKSETPAMELCYRVVPAMDGTAFELRLEDVAMRASKVKVVAWDWFSPFGIDVLNPWSIVTDGPSGIPRDEDVDLTILATVQGIWTDGEDIHVEEVARQQISKKKVKLAGWDDTKPTFAEKCEALVPVANDDHTFSNLFPSVPRSKIGSDSWGTGNFVLTILVTEDDEFGVRVKELAAKFDEHKQTLIDSVTSAFQ